MTESEETNPKKTRPRETCRSRRRSRGYGQRGESIPSPVAPPAGHRRSRPSKRERAELAKGGNDELPAGVRVGGNKPDEAEGVLKK